MRKTTLILSSLILATLTFSPNLYALFEGARYFSSLGYMNENLTRTTDNAEGTTSFLGTANSMPIFLGMSVAVGAENRKFTPKIGYTPLPREDKDGAVKVEYLILSFPFVKPLGAGAFDYMIGTSYFKQTFKGAGGTISSSNGGSPATFYAGDYDQSAQYMTVDLGLGYNFAPMRISTDLFILSALSDKRSYNLMVNFTHFWGTN